MLKTRQLQRDYEASTNKKTLEHECCKNRKHVVSVKATESLRQSRFGRAAVNVKAAEPQRQSRCYCESGRAALKLEGGGAAVAVKAAEPRARNT